MSHSKRAILKPDWVSQNLLKVIIQVFFVHVLVADCAKVRELCYQPVKNVTRRVNAASRQPI